MDLINTAKSLTSFVYERASSPFFWILLVCFTLNHWNDLLVLMFSDDSIHEKVAYVRNSVDTATPIYFHYSSPSPFFYVINPFLSAILVSTVYPIITVFCSFVSDFAVTCRNHISQFFDSKRFLSKDVSNELREERAMLFKTFDAQVEEARKQLRESQDQFTNSQLNCSALFCALAFSRGYESLLPNTDLASSFIAINSEQRDILLALNKASPATGSSIGIKVEDLSRAIPTLKYLHSIQNITEDELFSLIKELVDQGAIAVNYQRSTAAAADMTFGSFIKLTNNGKKFVSVTNAIADGNLAGAINLG